MTQEKHSEVSTKTGCDVTELLSAAIPNTPVVGKEYYVVFLAEFPNALRIDTMELTLKYWEPNQSYTTKDKIKIFSSLIKNNLKEKPSRIIILNFMPL